MAPASPPNFIILAIHKLTIHTQDRPPWLMLFSDNIVLIDNKLDGINGIDCELELSTILETKILG